MSNKQVKKYEDQKKITRLMELCEHHSAKDLEDFLSSWSNTHRDFVVRKLQKSCPYPSPMQLAIAEERVEIIKVLSEIGFDVNGSVKKEDGQEIGCLDYAIDRNKIESFKMLLKLEASPFKVKYFSGLILSDDLEDFREILGSFMLGMIMLTMRNLPVRSPSSISF